MSKPIGIIGIGENPTFKIGIGENPTFKIGILDFSALVCESLTSDFRVLKW